MADISDRDSAAVQLNEVRRLANRVLDLDHPDRIYQASKAAQLAGAAANLANDLGLLARSQRIRIHLGLEHGHQVPDRDALDCADWLDRHQAAHRGASKRLATHTHDPGDDLLNPAAPSDRR
jgi:hypothetical protein